MVSTETAHARDPEGVSSTAMMLMSSAIAVENARATVWLAPSQTNPGARAPSAVARQPATAATSNTRRRPRRSATATTARASSAPTRTTDSVQPTAESETSKSSLKKVLVCVSSVPR